MKRFISFMLTNDILGIYFTCKYESCNSYKLVIMEESLEIYYCVYIYIYIYVLSILIYNYIII